MKNYKALRAILFVSIISFSFIQNGKKELKEWNIQSKLLWQDFKGKPNNNSGRAAISDCGISCQMIGEKDTLRFVVKSYFNLTDSWVKKDDENDFLLKHEQGHFDINEIFARKIRKAIKEAKLNKVNANSDFRSLQVKYFTLLNEEQILYDNETKHSVNKIKQLEWDEKIKGQLNELESYYSNIVLVPYFK